VTGRVKNQAHIQGAWGRIPKIKEMAKVVSVPMDSSTADKIAQACKRKGCQKYQA
jgi:hypothetical protein